MDSIQGAGSIYDWCDECDDLVKALPSLIDQAFYRALTHQKMKRDTDPLVDCAWGASLSYALPIGLVPLVPMTHSLADRATDAALAYLAGLPGLFFLLSFCCRCWWFSKSVGRQGKRRSGEVSEKRGPVEDSSVPWSRNKRWSLSIRPTSRLSLFRPRPSPMEISAILENRRKLEMWEQCQNVKAALIKLERVQGTFLRAQQNFPSVNDRDALTDAIDKALVENMTGEQAQRGINPNACLRDMQCYRDWLSRAYRGTRWEEENAALNPHPTPTFKRGARDLDLASSIHPVPSFP